jgi:hypothetical protein
MSLSPGLHFFIAATIVRDVTQHEVTQKTRLHRTILVWGVGWRGRLVCGGRGKRCLVSSCTRHTDLTLVLNRANKLEEVLAASIWWGQVGRQTRMCRPAFGCVHAVVTCSQHPNIKLSHSSGLSRLHLLTYPHHGLVRSAFWIKYGLGVLVLSMMQGWKSITLIARNNERFVL